ncbi:integrative and conjugative element protein (TIGR02256 family) [Bradyrhizobium sp. CIR18]|uniref:Mov34/MPN/PAD-1 family protein n=1 Tax=Bradyrhizobium sp. CIR18 TaxID=2663839 RepID=UPI001605BD85|nr:Mov34/MPN/PAD-1 family protein [Bradyrhizobium sp. CIR18]MBB4365010.1 integrative and conjugative element protein (TIGR02256 family) [Bradyrhizobium sp. CIR18]
MPTTSEMPKMQRGISVTVWLSSQVMQRMCSLARDLSPLENGGILLGWRSGEDLIVVDLRGPGPQALHARHCFIPDHVWQVAEINRAFEASRGDLDYLGDWHSHPDSVAEMSKLDSATLLRITRKVSAPLMLIVAGSGTDWSSRCWKGQIARSFLRRRLVATQQKLNIFDPPEQWPGATGT